MKKNKIIAIFLVNLFVFATFSITAFAVETQTAIVAEETSTRYVLGKEVNIVFRDYIKESQKFPDKDTVTKSQLYSAIRKSGHEYDLPERILLDLKNNLIELITEENLFMYLETIEKNDNDLTIDFSYETWVIIILLLAIIWLVTPKSYNDSLKEIAKAIRNSRS